MRRRDKRADAALRDLRHDDSTVRMEAADVLVDFAFRVTVRCGRPPRAQVDHAYARLRHAVAHDPAPEVRLAAAYALSHWHQARAARALLVALESARELPNVRGQAAEGIGWTLGADRGSNALRTRASDALRRGLGDASADVRFWCVYAAGHLVAKELRDRLAELAENDGAVCTGMWAIKDEAADVIAFWDDGGWADRSPDSIAQMRAREPAAAP